MSIKVERCLIDPIKDSNNDKSNVLLLKYPILKKIAKDVLAILVPTVASESTFNTGGLIIDEYRSSLIAAMIEASN